ncbi:MAG: radical SAM protein [Magnetospiraceae bacterium]
MDTPFERADIPPLAPEKFRDPGVTAKGDARAHVALEKLSTLWFNTGSLCNITCQDCYMESSPKNDRLAYITQAEVDRFLDEAARENLGLAEVGLTGGEPFMNPEIIPILHSILARGLRLLVLTNAMKPLHHKKKQLLDLPDAWRRHLTLRVSLDHHTQARHDALRGAGSWDKALAGLTWLAQHGFTVTVAGRAYWTETAAAARAGYARLFAELGLTIDAENPATLVVFPEMVAAGDVPEITTACWDILGVSPQSVMCATSRMIVKRKGAAAASVVPCTLLPYDARFDLGGSLAQAPKQVPLNHPYCARFCVLGGASCTAN